MFFTLFNKFRRLRRLRSVHLLRLQDHFIESRDNIGLAARENAVAVGDRGGGVFDDCVDFTRNEEHFLDEFVVGVHGQPHVDKLFWEGLNKLRDLELTKFLLLHNHVCLGCLGWIAELVCIRRLIGHFSELFSCLIGLEDTGCFIYLTVGVLVLELLQASGVHNGLDQSQSLIKKAQK